MADQHNVQNVSATATNLFHHLNRYRPKQNSESISLRYHASVSLPASSQQTSLTASTSQTSLRHPTLSAVFSATAPYEKEAKRHKDISSAITHCTAKDMMPISKVETQGFKKLMTVTDTKYTLPNISPCAGRRVEGQGGPAQRW